MAQTNGIANHPNKHMYELMNEVEAIHRQQALDYLEKALSVSGEPCSLRLIDKGPERFVKIIYFGGYSKTVNVTGDSPAAMMLDVIHRGFLG